MTFAPEPSFLPAMRASLEAKHERLLQRPLIATLQRPGTTTPDFGFDDELPDVFRVLCEAAGSVAPEPTGVSWDADPRTGTVTLDVDIDYDDRWRDNEKEVLETARATVEESVVFLTDAQRLLLERTPREFLDLAEAPVSMELVEVHTERVGGVERVVRLVIAEAPESTQGLRHVAIIPNLIPIQRQLQALSALEHADPEGPLAPLRLLAGLPGFLSESSGDGAPAAGRTAKDKLDEHQADCVARALRTPHFAVIHGPPGSGKTTTITTILRRIVAAGGRALVVSPTHAAVDNVIEKLTPRPDAVATDALDPASIPVRYAARRSRLNERALAYWVGPKKQLRAATIATRLSARLAEASPLAAAAFAKVNVNLEGTASLSVAVARVARVLCGTPIGLLSCDSVRDADPGSFDVLIVDEVSKLTLPEFLAIAVKARRWVLVGDPQQLPPYNAAVENAVTLDGVLSPELDLVCSIGAIIETTRLADRSSMRLLVVANAPERVARAARAHLGERQMRDAPTVWAHTEGISRGVVVCQPEELDAAANELGALARRDRTFNPHGRADLRVLVERGVTVQRPSFAGGLRFVEPRDRAQSLIFSTPYEVFHAQPWSHRIGQKLKIEPLRNGIPNYLPSAAALRVLSGEAYVAACAASDGPVAEPPDADHKAAALLTQIAIRYAINALSVYDWVQGLPAVDFDSAPLSALPGVLAPVAGLQEAIRPFHGTLRKQYRMHPTISKIPRELFYFGEALHDGAPGTTTGNRARLVRVTGQQASDESNPEEVAAIAKILRDTAGAAKPDARPTPVMIITPYRAQERALNRMIDDLRRRKSLDALEIEVCTLDRCQGREADYVIISLVRGRSTIFLDSPKRWNVALTRAMHGLFLVGDIDAYLNEARKAREESVRFGRPDRPHMSVLARVLDAYHTQELTARRASRS